MHIGPYRIERLSDGLFHLDGGAMYGVIPRVLWSRKAPPDEMNRIALGLNCLLLRGDGRTVLVDAGIGDKFSEKERAMYGIERREGELLEALAAMDIAPEEVTDVILTHLHFDHGGGLTLRREGAILPTFPRARHHVQRSNWDWAMKPTERDQASYLKENYAVLEELDLLRFLDGDVEILPGIHAMGTKGHTTGHQMVRIEGPEGTAVYCGDLIPTSWHLPLPWIMGYDLRPLETLEEKRSLLARASEGNWTLFFEHDPDPARFAGKVALDAKGRYHLAEAVNLD